MDFFAGELQTIQGHLPFFQIFCNKDLKPVHWKEIFALCGSKTTAEQFSFNDLLKMEVATHIEEIDEISMRASGEALIQNQLAKIRDKWALLQFSVVAFANYTDKFKISGTSAIFIK